MIVSAVFTIVLTAGDGFGIAETYFYRMFTVKAMLFAIVDNHAGFALGVADFSGVGALYIVSFNCLHNDLL